MVGAVACVVLPAASWVEGSRTFAWSMYSRAGEYRFDLTTVDAQGRVHQRNPTALAADAAPTEASLLAGSEHWRQGPSVASFRAHIGDLAAYACRELHAESVEITLRERSGALERATTVGRRCTE